MKTFFTFLTFPIICLIVFFSVKCYIAGDFVAAYSLVIAWFCSLTLWIQSIGLLFEKPAVVAPSVPRAYIPAKKSR